ncbi:MAG: CarD family transcriptional regulator [Solibacillus sp.]|jgi:CarD family transcriptional regulator|uniref:CarD family transcriptional regulator n=1 Tax=unclassified Solibacillus TaxID=2637870 RepID=UPI0030F621D1
MYAIGDTAFYGTNGICTIKDIQEKQFQGESQLYYVLESNVYPALVLYHPVHTENSKLQKIIPQQLAEEIISVFSQSPGEWNERHAVRMQLFKSTIDTRDHLKIAQLLNTILRKQQELKAMDKKLNQQDMQMAQQISTILYDELALVLNMSKVEVANKIDTLIQQ